MGLANAARLPRRSLRLQVSPDHAFDDRFMETCLTCCSGVYAETGETNNAASVGTVVFVWLYLTIFNFANPVLWSYPAEVQTYSMRSKGLLVWNTTKQLLSAYVTWVDAIALNAIGWKYYAVYMPLLVIQFFLAYRCKFSLPLLICKER